MPNENTIRKNLQSEFSGGNCVADIYGLIACIFEKQLGENVALVFGLACEIAEKHFNDAKPDFILPPIRAAKAIADKADLANGLNIANAVYWALQAGGENALAELQVISKDAQSEKQSQLIIDFVNNAMAYCRQVIKDNENV